MNKYLTGLLVASLFFISCKKETETFITESVNDYYPLQVGKYITYKLDSTIFLPFGTRDTVISYQVQDRVDAIVTDNLNRNGYRIIRYIRQDSTRDWVPNNTFMAIPTGTSIEYVENNLRYVKLQMPVKQDFSWKGNSFMDTYSNTTDLQYLDDWDYTYDSLGIPLMINSLSFDSTIKVAERDEFDGQDPSLPGSLYAEKTFSEEKYAKGIGLIYRDFTHWEFQGGQTGIPDYYSGYGVRLSIIDHN